MTKQVDVMLVQITQSLIVHYDVTIIIYAHKLYIAFFMQEMLYETKKKRVFNNS